MFVLVYSMGVFRVDGVPVDDKDYRQHMYIRYKFFSASGKPPLRASAAAEGPRHATITRRRRPLVLFGEEHGPRARLALVEELRRRVRVVDQPERPGVRQEHFM